MPYVELAFFKPDVSCSTGEIHSTTVKGGSGHDKTQCSCAICSTPLYIEVAALNGAWAVAANRISSFEFEPQAHIWTSAKLDDVLIPAGITQAPERPPKEILDIMVSNFLGEN